MDDSVAHDLPSWIEDNIGMATSVLMTCAVPN